MKNEDCGRHIVHADNTMHVLAHVVFEVTVEGLQWIGDLGKILSTYLDIVKFIIVFKVAGAAI